MKTKRVNKSKGQLISDRAHIEKVNREKTLVKMMFPLIENQKTIYDAQTVLQALSGFIKVKINEKIEAITLQELSFDLSQEEDSEIKTAILTLIEMLSPEKARETADLLERFGKTLAQYSANEYLKNPMSVITVDKIVAN